MTASTGSDRDVLRAVPRDADAFDEVFRRHRDRLWSVAVRTLGDPSDAEDAVQETFVAALRSCDFRGAAEIGTWLHRILMNKCIDRMRRTRPAATTDPDLPGAVTDPSGQVTTRLVVGDALAVLAPEQRAAIVLVDVEGRPVAEAARLLGVPPGTVKSRCARGRLRLAELLGHLREEP